MGSKTPDNDALYWYYNDGIATRSLQSEDMGFMPSEPSGPVTLFEDQMGIFSFEPKEEK